MATSTGETVGRAEGPAERENGGIEEDELFDVLANQRRRYALHALQGHADAEIGPLAERVAAWENDIAVAEVNSAERKRVYTALQQTHLPKMDGAGVVDFDKNRGVVEPTEAFEDATVYMDVVRGREIPWSQYYLALSAVAAALLAAVWVNAYPFSALPDLAWGVFAVVAFCVSSLVHYYYARGNRLGAGESPPELG
jgi:hypothetical protein